VELARTLESTLLRADATPGDVEALVGEAARLGLLGVCVSPRFVPLARTCAEGSGLVVVTVAGFPLGTSATATKVAEARLAVEEGASEVDLVVPVGLALYGAEGAVEAEVRAVREAVPGVALKVILETGYFGAERLARVAEAALRGGADFLKTSTGFGPRGVTVGDVRLLFELARGRAEVKASGGIRTRRFALELLEAGATRLGTSSAAEILSDPSG